jgi:hypothetical protein
MLLIACGCVPVLAAVLVLLWLRLARVRRAGAVRRAQRESSPLGSPGMSRRAALAEQIARTGSRPHRPRRSDAALRRRHLAAVIPADPRR